MRVLLDECLPFDLIPLLLGHHVQPVARRGWAGVKNGALLALAVPHFDCFLTIDERLAAQQAVPNTLMVVTVRARSNRVQDLQQLVPALLDVPTSYYEGSWDKGSKIKFLSADGSGMVSEIAENILYKFVSIKHLGEIKNGVEDTTSEAVKKWTPAFENYTFTEEGAETLLVVDMEMPETAEAKAMKEMFEGMWPKALLKLKEICEK